MTNTKTGRKYEGEAAAECSVRAAAFAPSPDAECVVEVRILWGASSLLHVAQVVPNEPFWVGESHRAHGEPGFVIDSEVLGAQHVPVVTWEDGPVALVPANSTCQVFRDGGWRQYDHELSALGRRVPLCWGERVRIELGELVLCVALVQLERSPTWAESGHRHMLNSRVLRYLMASVGLAAALLLSMYFAPPATSALNFDLLAEESRILSFLIEGQEQPPEDPLWAQSSPGQSEAGTRQAAEGEEGLAGQREANESEGRRAVQGEQVESTVTRSLTRDDAQNAGVLTALQAVAGSWATATSPYESESATGADAMSAMGALIGVQAGENFGFGGLALRGAGRRGGNHARGTLGVGALQTRGGPGAGCCGGLSGEGARGGRTGRVPRIRSGAAAVQGGLSSDVIRRVVRRNVPQVRACYEAQLSSRPDLEGRVLVSFIISASGAVQTSLLSTSTLGNAAAEQCIVRAVRRWSFPAPESGGIVRVNYPFTLSRIGG